MPVLTTSRLVKMRQYCAKKVSTVNYDKPQANTALQSIEDWFEANKGSLSTAINTATSPFVFTTARKKALIASWLLEKFNIEDA